MPRVTQSSRRKHEWERGHPAPLAGGTPALRHEVIREALLLRIGSGELAPGERIVEARLAGEFGVSPIPVSEASGNSSAWGCWSLGPRGPRAGDDRGAQGEDGAGEEGGTLTGSQAGTPHIVLRIVQILERFLQAIGPTFF